MDFIHPDLLDPKDELSAYRAKVSLVSALTTDVNQKRYGYSYRLSTSERMHIIPPLLDLYRREQVRKALGGGCLDTEHIQLVSDKLSKVSDNCDTATRLDIHKDESNKMSWLDSNPGCVGREPWEELKYMPCGPLRLGVDVDKKVCDIQVPIYSEKHQCEIEVEMDICKDVCDIVIAMETTGKECSLTLEALKQQCETCDIQLDSVQQCHTECGLGSTLLEAAKCKI